MNKAILVFRYSVLAAIAIVSLTILIKCGHWWWLWCSYEPDPIFLAVTEDVVFDAGDQKVKLPKGIVLYPVDERETQDKCYPGGQYKIYVNIENDASNLTSLGWPKGNTNLIHTLKR